MTLQHQGSKICCPHCSRSWDLTKGLKEGDSCPYLGCPSNAQRCIAIRGSFVARTRNGSAGRALKLAQQMEAVMSQHQDARRFFQELLDSVETLSGITEEHGSRTLADLMYLQNAIMNGSGIDHYPSESKVLEIASALPSGEQWSKFIKVEDSLETTQP